MNGPGHCSECHTPRNMFGAPRRDRFLGGTRDGPDGKPVPNITPHENGIGEWSKTDVTFALKTSILPDGDVLGGAMAEVVEDATSHWTDDDRGGRRVSPHGPAARGRTGAADAGARAGRLNRLVALQHTGSQFNQSVRPSKAWQRCDSAASCPSDRCPFAAQNLCKR